MTDSNDLLSLDLNARPTREVVILAHLLILGRPPASERKIQKGIECGTIALLRESLLSSKRFTSRRERRNAAPYLFFIHIPKTAGGSLRRYFKTVFGDSCIWRSQEKQADDQMRPGANFDAEEHISRYRISGGHVSFDEIPLSLIEQDPIFLSVIRDPVRRVLSSYNFIRTEVGHPSHDRLANMTLYEALTEDRRFKEQSGELQIQFLCGERNLEELKRVINRHEFIIGKQEHLDVFMVSLHEKLGLPLPSADRKQVHMQSTDYMAELAAQPHYAKAIEMIEAMNIMEYQFYNSFDSLRSSVRGNRRRYR